MDRKKTIRLLQIVFLTFFIIISLTSLHQNKNFSGPLDVVAKTSNTEDIGESTESIKIVIVNEESEQELPKEKEYAFTIVTGASENHFCPIKGFIYNLKGTLKGLNARMIIYDLGLTEIQRDELKSLKDNGFFHELRVFDFTKFPSFWNISEARGEYAWKPAIVAEVSKEFPGIITWLDSGTLPERTFFEELPILLKTYNGFLSPRSSGFMKNWTHPGVYEYYNDDASKYDDIPNCSGASVVFDTKMTQHIINEWYTCALDKNCIAPVGSDRRNHRQDQAILTYLVAREKHYCNIGGNHLWIHAHQDSNCEKIIDFYEKLYNIN